MQNWFSFSFPTTSHLIFQQMSERTLVPILVFWAILTIVTPTLILLSENSKRDLDLYGEVVKDRRMMGPYIENHITKTSNLITKATPAVTLVVAAEDLAPAPALAPTASASLGSGRANLTASYHIHNHTLGNNKSDDGVTLMSPREHLKQAKILSTTS